MYSVYALRDANREEPKTVFRKLCTAANGNAKRLLSL